MDYGKTVILNDPLLIAYVKVSALRSSAEEESFRKTAEGRRFLLLLAKERRKDPLVIRRFARKVGQAAAVFVDKMRFAALR